MYNKAIEIGRLTADPELKQTQSGISVCSFRIAVDRRYKEKDGKRKADFINIVAWRKQAEFVCNYFHKGDPIGIDGSIQTRNYEDKNGNKREAVEVVTEQVFFVGGKTSAKPADAPSEKPADQSYSSGPDTGYEEVDDDYDLPF